MGHLRLLILAALLWPFLPAAAEELPPLFSRPVRQDDPQYRAVAERLRRARVERGAFLQKKSTAVLSRPLISTGRFISSAEKGLCWRMLEPFAADTLFSPEGIFQRREGGSWQSVFPKGQAAVQGFVNVLRDVFAGDERKLHENFAVFFDGAPDRWRIGLLPERGEMKRFVRFMMLEGAHHIERLEIAEKNGDDAVIEFSAVSLDPPRLTEDEEGCFDR